MKKCIFSLILAIVFLVQTTLFAQQFNGNNNASDPINRQGTLDISPSGSGSNAQLHVAHPLFMTSGNTTTSTPAAEFNGLVKIGDMNWPTRIGIDIAAGNYTSTIGSNLRPRLHRSVLGVVHQCAAGQVDLLPQWRRLAATLHATA